MQMDASRQMSSQGPSGTLGASCSRMSSFLCRQLCLIYFLQGTCNREALTLRPGTLCRIPMIGKSANVYVHCSRMREGKITVGFSASLSISRQFIQSLPLLFE
jgi:hypothetical protein